MTRAPAWLTATPYAHRGLHDGNRAVPENSLPAFEAACLRGFGIELDVRVLADGRAVVFHDATLDRMTGQSGAVIDRTAADLASIALNGPTPAFIETLEKTLQQVAGRAPLLIEMKGDDAGDPAVLARAVAEALDGYEGQAAVMSFEQDLLDAFAARQTGRPLGLTAEGTSEAALKAHEPALALPVSFVSYNVMHLPNPFVARCRADGLATLSWTVRTPEQRRHSDAHVDQITFEGFDPGAA